MQQDNNNMEDKLRQLENQQLPDLSNMDRDWRNMQQMLAAGTAPNAANKPKSFFNLRRIFFAAASIAAIAFAALIYKNLQTNTNKNTTAPAVAKSTVNLKDAQQAFHDAVQKTATNTTAQRNVAQLKLVPHPKNGKNIPAATDNYTLVDDTPAAINDVASVDSKEMIESFYTSIQKPVQEFNIDADQGGTITAEEGSVFTIPPSAFIDANGKLVAGTVKIVVEEFYKYSDMIAANLTTSSDNRQLVTGGMVKITAILNGNPVSLKLDKEISLSIPTKNYDPGMKLFTSKDNDWSQTETDKNGMNMHAVYRVQDRNINWNSTGKQTGLPEYDGKTNVPDFLDQPYNVIKAFGKRIGKFSLSDNSTLTVAQMKAMLKEKYGDYYNVIKVKREDGSTGKASNFLFRGTLEKENVVGDSLRMTLQQALKSKYIDKKDIQFYAERVKADSILFYKTLFASRLYPNKFGGEILTHTKANSAKTSQADYSLLDEEISFDSLSDSSVSPLDMAYNEYIHAQKAYSFTIKKMGWINCDRFCENHNTTNFVINLPKDVQADKFVSQVVFMSIRSVMPGRTNNNQIGFSNVPVDMGAYVVGLGERNGKLVSFMQKLKIGKSEVSIDDLEETTPEAFRKKLSKLDMD